MITSPIRSMHKPFSIDPVDAINEFVDIGNAGKGRQHLLFFTTSLIDYQDLEILVDTRKTYSAELVQYLVRSQDGQVCGSLFEINKNKLEFKPHALAVIDSDLEQSFALEPSSFGGVLVISDQESSFLVIPENPNTNKYVVK